MAFALRRKIQSLEPDFYGQGFHLRKWNFFPSRIDMVQNPRLVTICCPLSFRQRFLAETIDLFAEGNPLRLGRVGNRQPDALCSLPCVRFRRILSKVATMTDRFESFRPGAPL